MSLQKDLERDWPRVAQDAALDQCGPYLLKAELASGSMGVVYLAQHQLTRAEAAVKLLRPELMGRAESRERFLREVSAASRIGHPGVVQVLDAGVDQHGRFYIAMERLQGDDFCNRLACGGLTVQQALGYIDALLDPLIAAHDAGLVHRDLKPENVFILDTEGPTRVKLLDFGIVRELDQKSATATGLVVGTPTYMSPEQALSPRSVGPATDVWAVGVMLYEVLTGRVPFDGESAHAVVIHACHDPHVPVHELVPQMDRRLSALVDRCLAKDPSQRPAHARALKQELSALLGTPHLDVSMRPRAAPLPSPGLPTPTTDTQPPIHKASIPPPAKPNTLIWMLILVAAGSLGVASVWFLSHLEAPKREADAAPRRPPPPARAAESAPAPPPKSPLPDAVQTSTSPTVTEPSPEANVAPPAKRKTETRAPAPSALDAPVAMQEPVLSAEEVNAPAVVPETPTTVVTPLPSAVPEPVAVAPRPPEPAQPKPVATEPTKKAPAAPAKPQPAAPQRPGFVTF